MATIKSDEKLQTQNFFVEIVGLHPKLPNVVSCDLGMATMELNEATEGTSKHREFVCANGGTFQPVTIVMHNIQDKKVADWVKSSGGKKERRDVTLVMLKRDGKTEARRITAEGCWPQSHDKGNSNSKDSSGQTETVVLEVGRVLFG